MKRFIYCSFIVLAIAACSEEKAPQRKFVNAAEFDASVKPGDNFFRYVNGKWYDTARIADDQAGVGTYRFLNIPQKKLLQNILESVSQTEHTPGSIEQKVGDFYASGMDTARINARGFEPIKPMLDQIEALKKQIAALE